MRQARQYRIINDNLSGDWWIRDTDSLGSLIFRLEGLASAVYDRVQAAIYRAIAGLEGRAARTAERKAILGVLALYKLAYKRTPGVYAKK